MFNLTVARTFEDLEAVDKLCRAETNSFLGISSSAEFKTYTLHFTEAPNPTLASRVTGFITAQTQLEYVEPLVEKAMEFGTNLLISFRSENVLMGVIQDNMTSYLLTTLGGVMEAVLAGSLSEAIARTKAIPTATFDGKYLTVPRVILFINKIETYLGIPLTTELPN